MITKYVYEVTSDDLQLIQKLIDIKNKGLMTDGTRVTNLYNRVLGKTAKPTNCSSCIRSRITELERWYNNYKKTLELNKQEEEPTEPILSPSELSKEEVVNNIPQEENKPKNKGVAKKSK